MADELCLRVLDYSSAVLRQMDGDIPSAHVTGSDLFIVVKGINHASLWMEVLQGTEVLKSLDIAKYIDSALNSCHSSEQVGLGLQTQKPPIFVLLQDSLLVIKYCPGDGQLHQLKFQMESVSACHEIARVFRRHGMRFIKQPLGTAQPGCVALGFGATQGDPKTTQEISSYFERPNTAHGKPFKSPSTVKAGSLSRLNSISPERRPAGSTDQFGRPNSVSHDVASLRRNKTTAPGKTVPSRPTITQMPPSCPTRSLQPQYRDTSNHTVPHANQWNQRLLSTFSVHDPNKAHELSQDYELPLKASQDMAPPPPSRPPQSQEKWSSSDFGYLTAALQSSDTLENCPRPASSSNSTMPKTAEHDIPPRRELPFGRLQSHPSESDRSGLRPHTTTTLTFPPLRKSKVITNLPGTHARADSASQNKFDPSLRSSTFLLRKPSSNALQVNNTDLEFSASESTDTTVRNSSPIQEASTAQQTAAPAALATTPPRMDDLLFGQEPFAKRSVDASVFRFNSISNTPYETELASQMSEWQPTHPDRILAIPAATGTNATNNYTLDEYAATSSPTHDAEGSNLHEYAAQSRDDRMAALDNFLLENLENPAFKQLCEDVDNCWRRIALGL